MICDSYQLLIKDANDLLLVRLSLISIMGIELLS
jgi:hypothetical protein